MANKKTNGKETKKSGTKKKTTQDIAVPTGANQGISLAGNGMDLSQTGGINPSQVSLGPSIDPRYGQAPEDIAQRPPVEQQQPITQPGTAAPEPEPYPEAGMGWKIARAFLGVTPFGLIPHAHIAEQEEKAKIMRKRDETNTQFFMDYLKENPEEAGTMIKSPKFRDSVMRSTGMDPEILADLAAQGADTKNIQNLIALNEAGIRVVPPGEKPGGQTFQHNGKTFMYYDQPLIINKNQQAFNPQTGELIFDANSSMAKEAVDTIRKQTNLSEEQAGLLYWDAKPKEDIASVTQGDTLMLYDKNNINNRQLFKVGNLKKSGIKMQPVQDGFHFHGLLMYDPETTTVDEQTGMSIPLHHFISLQDLLKPRIEMEAPEGQNIPENVSDRRAWYERWLEGIMQGLMKGINEKWDLKPISGATMDLMDEEIGGEETDVNNWILRGENNAS